MTVLEVIVSAAGYLEKNGVEHPRLNAEHLLAHALGMRRLDLYLAFDRPLSESERAPLRESAKRRAAGVPLQHLLGTAAFYGRDFLCDARALIPRPETERLAELVLGEIRNHPSPTLLDVGTGSGVIALTIALERPDAVVLATDVSEDALALAAENAARHAADGRVQWILADLLPEGMGAIDFIVANLPYVASADLDGLSREVQHDPVLALDGGPDGLDLVRALAQRIDGGASGGTGLAIEIGAGQSSTARDILEANNFQDISVERDYQGIDRFVIARHG